MKGLFVVVAILLLVAVLWWESTHSHHKTAPPTVTLTISGAFSIYPLVEKWGEAFKALHPEVKLNISAGGAGKGMTDTLAGAVDIGMVSREVDKAEIAKGAFPIFIAKDAVFPVINTANPARAQIAAHGISLATFRKIFVEGSVTDWAQAAGGPKVPIHLYTRSDACGAASAWASTLGKYKQENLKGIGINGDPGLLDAVRKDPAGLGYNNLGFLFTAENTADGVLIVPIDVKGNGQLDAHARIDTRDQAYQEIASGRYPGARREYLVTKGPPAGIAQAFIAYTLSPSGIALLKSQGGYVPLSDGEISKEQAKLH